MSLGVVGYHCFLTIDYYVLHSNIFHIQIFRFIGEIITIPLVFLIYPGLFVFSIIHCIHEKFRIKSWSFWSFLILLIGNPFCVKYVLNLL